MTLTLSDPTDAVRQLDAAFNRGDLDALLSFYEEEAVVGFEPGRVIQGRAALRPVFERVFRLAPQARCLHSEVLQSGDLALYLSHWELSAPGVDGGEVRRRGIATSVLRRNAEGRWRLVLDNPWGPELLGLSPFPEE